MIMADGRFEVTGPEYTRPDQPRPETAGRFEVTGPAYQRPDLPRAEAPLPTPPQPPGPFEQRVQEYLPQMQESERQRGYRLPSAEIPIITPLAERGAAAIAAATGAGTGEGFGERYSDLLARMQARKRAYEQANPISAMAGEAGGFAAGLATTPVLGIGQRASGVLRPIIGAGTEAAGYGAAEEAAKIAPDETPMQRAERIASSAATGFGVGAGLRTAIPIVGKLREGASAVREYLSPSSRQAAESIAEAARAAPVGSRGLTPEEFKRLSDQGYPVSVADIQGVQPTIQSAMGRRPGQGQDFAQDLQERLQRVGTDTQGVIDEMLYPRIAASRPVSMANEPITADPAYLRAVAQASRKEAVSPAYDTAYSAPAAQNIWPMLPPVNPQAQPMHLGWLINTDAGREAVRKAARDLDLRYQGQSGYGEYGPFVVKSDGVLMLPTRQNVPLEFWDVVKRKLDEEVGALYRTGATDSGNALSQTRDAFRDSLALMVPEYKEALKTASRYIRGDNAFDAGIEFFPMIAKLNAPRGATSANLVDDISTQMRNFNREFSDNEKQHFALGMMSYIRANPNNAATTLVNARGPVLDMYKTILGNDFNKVMDAMLYHNTVRTTGILQGQASPIGHMGQQATLAVINALSGVPFVGQAMGHAGLFGLNMAQQRRAQNILDIASDPNRHSELLRLIQSSSQDRRLLERLQPYLTRASLAITEPPETGLGNVYNVLEQATEQAEQASQRRQPQRFAGGRVGRASGGRLVRSDHASRAAALIRAAEAAKKAHNNTTKDILEQPDEAVAKALSIANKAI